MTGFGKASCAVYPWTIDVEVKTVNNRYFDFRVRMPNALNALETAVKQACQLAFVRGRIEVNIAMRSSESNRTLLVDKAYAEKVHAELVALQKTLAIEKPIGLRDIVTVEGVMRSEPEEFDVEDFREATIATVTEACTHCNEMRAAEGERIGDNLLEKLETLEEVRGQIVTRAPQIVSEEQARLRRKVKELLDGRDLDETIVANEIALYAQKADIDEETVRLSSHITQFTETLKSKKPIGKTLDFLIQEMNREVNTMSSKSNDTALTKYCIEGKTIIEQLREQIQNVE